MQRVDTDQECSVCRKTTNRVWVLFRDGTARAAFCTPCASALERLLVARHSRKEETTDGETAQD